MGSSEWLSIALTLVGTISGAAIAWAFFRAQQLMNFRSIEAQMQSIEKQIILLGEAAKLSNYVDVARELGSVRSSMAELNTKVGSLSNGIVKEIRRQQVELLNTVQTQFDKHVNDSRAALSSAVEREINAAIPGQNQAALLNRLIDIATEALGTMGRFQRAAIEEQSQATLVAFERKVESSISDLKTDVIKVQDQLQTFNQPPALHTSLPPPR